MPNKADVVIIGGGVTGNAIAYNLAKEGLKPVVIEKSDIGGEASGSTGGGVRQSARNLKEMPMAMESIRLYGQLHEELGMDVEYVREGNLRLCTSEEELETMRTSVENQKSVGLNLEMIDRKQILKINPFVGEKVIGAGYCPTDGHVNPFLVTYAFFKKAKSLGALYHTHEEVTDIRLRRGKVVAVITDKQEVETDLVVNAAGITGRKVANMVGIDLPMRPVFTEALITEPYPPFFKQMIGHAKGLFYGRQTVHGPFLWGGFVGTETFIHQGGKPLFHFIGPAISRMVIDFFPILKDFHVIRTWSGLIAQMSDGIPVLGLVDEVPGFVFATGFSGHGFGLAPVIGRLISELIMDCEASIPINDFCYSRFYRGGDHECACKGNAACTTVTAICPNKREWLKSI
ncbi:MAG: FAD-binding oxidoreductase [Desulfobacterales bacterium]|jgi:sarcosine oxidase subunit beta|nr:FAD-binding oxidoreductase [Desulfobacterales bacterium]MDP6681725.1 FAD-binding oxidoreductase [Desulfobacterales bacterium]MDP6807460.1 FAD-binding oxidoreductase [Desulfobacterales bacterium]|tara:strand:+ start:12983 stop:14188 length:1206 start_codon:yes stop_codon:yes gene_type:complete